MRVDVSPQHLDRLQLLFGETRAPENRRFCESLARALNDSPVPEAILVGLERLSAVVSDRSALVQKLSSSPRALEILSKLFAGSPYLTNILLREPSLLDHLTSPHLLGEIRSRPEFFDGAWQSVGLAASLEGQMAALRRFQQGELLRIGVCDFLGLLDLRSVTNQLSLLADAIVQAALLIVSDESSSQENDRRISTATRPSIAVLALGKLGGEELNYSSDIDLIFVSDGDPMIWTNIVQQFTRVLSDVSSCGLLYRVDLRLRPWGNAGPLVMPGAAYFEYLQQPAQQWEKQALLKARCIAGDIPFGQRFLDSCRPLIFSANPEDVRRSVLLAKKRIEQNLERHGKGSGEVKLGVGTIRDIEFVVQCLQLQHGREVKDVRSINTLDGLVRLADFGFVLGNEFRELSSAYVFFRVIEHALQLKHSRQTHTLPSDPAELETLARRLDFLDSSQLATHFRQHRAAVRRIFEKYVGELSSTTHDPNRHLPAVTTTPAFGPRWDLLERVSDTEPLIVEWQPSSDAMGQMTIAGFDQLGDLSMICGLLFVFGFDVVEGQVATEGAGIERTTTSPLPLRFLNTFVVRLRATSADRNVHSEIVRLRSELTELLAEARAGRRREAQARLAKRVSEALPHERAANTIHSPVEIEFDNDSNERTTELRITAEDTSGLLYELTNAIALLGLDIRQMEIRTIGTRVRDTLHVTDECGRKLLDPRRQQELRAAIVLIQHFTDVLPQAPDPEAALLHFQQLLEGELRKPDWLERITSLRQPKVLAALAKLLGVSDLFWEDFLRLQHEHLLPLLTDLDALQHPKSADELTLEITLKLAEQKTFAERCDRLNLFKDREMFRIDMRHVAGPVTEFTTFSEELSTLAEVVVVAGCQLAESELAVRSRLVMPACDSVATSSSRTEPSKPILCVAALGKLGGRELGFASDIELLVVFDDRQGFVPTNVEYCERFVELLQQTIRAKRAGIFQIDLRLRPHGRAGNLAVSFHEFLRYFAADGAAWPFERQSLIKLRPIAGDAGFAAELLQRRDELIFCETRWDPIPVRAMRERQVRQLVQAGTFHAKLSPGALVDIEYLVQLLQLSNGQHQPQLRTTNTLDAIAELEQLEGVPVGSMSKLRDAYLFFRRLIDCLRMTRGAANDLTLPSDDSEELRGLARRMSQSPVELTGSAEQFAAATRDLATVLGWAIIPA